MATLFAFKRGGNFLCHVHRNIWLGGNVTHAVVKIANYTTNYDFVDITRVLNVYGLNGFYALCMRERMHADRYS